MKTELLIAALARGAGPAPRALLLKRLGPALAVGAVLAVAGALSEFPMVGREVMADTGWLIKIGYTLALAALAAACIERLAKPGAGTRLRTWGLVLPFGLIAVLALLEWRELSAHERVATWLGSSWDHCPYWVFMLSLPSLALGLWALRGMAPTQPVRSGFVLGLLAGGIGASGYALICPEVSMTFIASWYTLGIVAVAALGAILGPRVLRW